MAGTRKARVPMAEQIRIINACRKSGMTDADWCRENDIAVSEYSGRFYTPIPEIGNHRSDMKETAIPF